MRRVIVFGFLATFVSSFGQTFFLGLFSPQFQAAAGIGSTRVSLLYGVATLASGSLLFWLGGAMDRLPLRRAIVITLLLFVTGSLLAAGVQGSLVLLAAFFLLRIGGQGLLTQLAVVSAARNGGRRRGAVIAWASMGVILGEAILPAGVIAALDSIDWRALWLGIATVLVVLVGPALWWLQHGIHWQERAPTADPSSAPALRRRTLLRTPAFWAGAAILLLPPFMATGFLFEQSSIAALKDWPAGAIGAAFTVFAVLRALGTWIYGRATDRFGAARMARLHLIPMALSFASLALPLGPGSIWIAFAGIGFTNGANSVLGGALWADLFGTAAVGTVRGVFTAAMVIASALAPITVAGVLSLGLGAGGLGLLFAACALAVPLLAAPWLDPRKDPATR
ncbi:hypothetical protein SAOR_01540 [Salinisphaera orenii MK-B5]|uniref:Major facilitator superfamily (MFS) profile domain-containing protein n=1 Tax=Salinisphaera orenii MK-B5 TaxID=856730 RepID=A0A423PYE0_9GAMM|nr:MFS transporter [Salinisphaera orenii]ROO30621.1 hypothetical protein SAOR_01540 [Salinisphaera orenii MK-B5]